MKQRFLNFMKDRYGWDILNNIIIYLSLGFAVVNLFKKSEVLTLTSFILFSIALFRMLSPIYSRLLKFSSKDRKNYKYFKCKNCGQELRIPKGKGKIKVICPNCKYEEIKKS